MIDDFFEYKIQSELIRTTERRAESDDRNLILVRLDNVVERNCHLVVEEVEKTKVSDISCVTVSK